MFRAENNVAAIKNSSYLCKANEKKCDESVGNGVNACAGFTGGKLTAGTARQQT